MSLTGHYLFALLALVAAPAAVAATLPESLKLEYSLTRNGIDIGEVSRHLKRRADGGYLHTMWTRPTGMARLLTQTEWREEGEFTVHGTAVRPRRFSETRTGDKRAYEHRATFDFEKSQVVLGNTVPRSMPAGLQDQSSVIYLMMLSPLTSEGDRLLPLTNGKEIETYRFTYQGKEMLPTLFGERETIVIRRVSQKQVEQELRCRTQSQPAADCEQPDDFTYWLLAEKQHLPVKLERRRKGDVTTMTLRAVQQIP